MPYIIPYIEPPDRWARFGRDWDRRFASLGCCVAEGRAGTARNGPTIIVAASVSFRAGGEAIVSARVTMLTLAFTMIRRRLTIERMQPQ